MTHFAARPSAPDVALCADSSPRLPSLSIASRQVIAAVVVWLAATGVSVPTDARAQCAEYGDFMHLVSRVGMPADARGVALSGSLAFVACRAAGIVVVDVTDSASPVVVGRLDTPGEAVDLAFAGTVLCVADGDAGLAVVDVSVPTSPVLQASLDFGGTAYNVAATDGFAFVAAGDQGLIAIDLANPAAPAIIGQAALPDHAVDIALQDDCAYVTGGSYLTVIDLEDPASPVVMGSTPAGGMYVANVAVAGDYAYVIDVSPEPHALYFGLSVIRTTDPLHPDHVRSLSLPSYSSGLAVADGRLYVVSEHIRRYDLANPAAPHFAGSVAAGGGQHLAVSGSYLYIAAGPTGFDIVDISSPAVPQISSLEMTVDATNIAATGSTAFVAAGWDGLVVAQVGGATTPEVSASLQFPSGSNCFAIAVSGATVAAACYIPELGSYLHLVDATDPTRPSVLGSTTISSSACAVALTPDCAYIATRESGLEIVDISDPAHPTVAGSVDTPGSAADVAVRGHLALVADGPAGLQVIDAADPRQPRLLGGVATGGLAVAVAVVDERAYVATASGGLALVDITIPEQPRVLSNVGTWMNAIDVVANDRFAYVVESGALSVVDVADPSDPVALGYITVPWGARGAAFAGGDVCVIGRQYAWSDPWIGAIFRGQIRSLPGQCDAGTPCSLGFFEAWEAGDGVRVRWRFESDATRQRFRLDGDNGAESWNVEWSADETTGFYEALDTASRPGPGGEVTYRLYLESVDAQWLPLGTTTVRLSGREGLPLLSTPAPNPFNPLTTIRFRLPSDGAVLLAVYDISGRLVRTLMDGTAPSGTHEVHWDGRDDSGRDAGSGTYFVRLESGVRAETVAVGLVR